MEPMGSNPRSTGCQGLEIHRILQAEPEVGQPRARLLAIPRGWQSGGILSGYTAFLPEPSYPRTTRQGDQGRAGRHSEAVNKLNFSPWWRRDQVVHDAVTQIDLNG